jgi:tRNA(Arg) A34 adenosine deaminase TadA
MQCAIREARKNLKTMNGGPFGACIVKSGKIIALARNTVLKDDATCHAEINAIRIASRSLGTFDLSGAVIYSTTEPCPMCFSAVHWARIKRIVYGSSIRDARCAGFNELLLSNRRIKNLTKISLRITPHVLRRECRDLFTEWVRCDNKRFY